MPDRETSMHRGNDGDLSAMEALKKHREKRRAKTQVHSCSPTICTSKGGSHLLDSDVGTSNETPTTRTEEASIEDDFALNNEETKGNGSNSNLVTTVVLATELDREKMRKISILGLEDPADKAMTSRHHVHHRRRQLGDKSGPFIVATTPESNEMMRKISVLGLEDPADRKVSSSPRSEQRRRERRAQSAGLTRPLRSKRHERLLSEVTAINATPPAAVETSRETEAIDESSRARCGLIGAPPLDTLIEDPRRRSRSLGRDTPLVDASSKIDRTTRSRSLEIDQPLWSMEEEDQPDNFPPVQLIIPQNEAFRDLRNRGPKEFKGIVETTKEKKKLMRQVSALGMQDPVFGDIHKDMEVSHASMVFEDIDYNDVPKDMQGLLQHESEHTDSARELRRRFSPKEEKGGKDRNSSLKNFAPPAGSFVRKTSHRAVSPPLPESRKSTVRRSPRSRKEKFVVVTEVNTTDGTSSKSTNSSEYVPPAGSFYARKPRERSATPTRRALLKDIELANKAQSMFSGDRLLSMSACKLEQSMATLNASLGSLNFDPEDLLEEEGCRQHLPPASPDSSSNSPTSKPKKKRGSFLALLTRRARSPTPTRTERKTSQRRGRRSSLGARGQVDTSIPPPSPVPAADTKPPKVERRNSLGSWDGRDATGGKVPAEHHATSGVTKADTSPLWASMSVLQTNGIFRQGQ